MSTDSISVIPTFASLAQSGRALVLQTIGHSFDSNTRYFFMNTNTKGRVAELIAATKYVTLGYVVLEPINKDGVYDFVIEKDGIFKKVQVKTLFDAGAVYTLNLRSITHNRIVNKIKVYHEIDLFVGVDIVKNIVIAFPFDSKVTSVIYFRKEPTISNQKSKVRWAKDFEI